MYWGWREVNGDMMGRGRAVGGKSGEMRVTREEGRGGDEKGPRWKEMAKGGEEGCKEGGEVMREVRGMRRVGGKMGRRVG